MTLLGWNSEYGSLVGTTVGAAGLFFTGWGLYLTARELRQANQSKFTELHRAIIRDLLSDPGTENVLDPKADSSTISLKEVYAANGLLLHLSSVFRAAEYHLYRLPEKIDADVRYMLSLPIMRSVWAMKKEFYNDDFVEFVEKILRGETKR